MKKIFVLLFGMLAASQVFAQTVNLVCGTGAPANFPVTANTFVVRSFPIRCSTNVVATAAQTTVAFGVGALSTKGKSYFQGTTGGGAINGTPCGTTCTAGLETTNLNNLVNAAT